MTDELVPATWQEALALVRAEIADALEDDESELSIDGYLADLETHIDNASIYLPAVAASAIALYNDPHEELTRICYLVTSKQQDYGSRNIMKFGHAGIAVRLSDKLERLRNLLTKPDTAAQNESLSDTWDDIVGYGLVGLMLGLGWFELPLENDLP